MYYYSTMIGLLIIISIRIGYDKYRYHQYDKAVKYRIVEF
jgi:hypothetical protein